jgi:hypothetical protein
VAQRQAGLPLLDGKSPETFSGCPETRTKKMKQAPDFSQE